MKLFFPLFFLLLNLSAAYAGQKDSLTSLVETYIDRTDPALPLVDFIIEQNISDVSICKGSNKNYFLTGTSGDKKGVQDGIKIWASKDLISWNIIGTNGYVWTFEGDAVEWQKKIVSVNGLRQRGIIAPEIHYLKNNYWITYTNSNSNQSGLLKSLSGAAQGPYVEVNGDEPMVKGTDASLFMDSDSSVYFIWNNGLVHKMKKDMTGFSTLEPRVLLDDKGRGLQDRGIRILNIDGKYVLSATRNDTKWSTGKQEPDETVSTRFEGVIATSNRFFGPYTYQKELITHAGKGALFSDYEDNLWFTISGEDVGSPVSGHPALLPIEKTQDGKFLIKHLYPFQASDEFEIVYVSKDGNNSVGNNWSNAYTSLERAIENAPNKAQLWIAQGKYDAPIQMNLRRGLYLYGGFVGVEKKLEERDPEKNKVIVNGKNYAKHVIAISSCQYIRLDGLTIQGGNASGGSFHHHYGAGLHVLGGGETIRIVNCYFENNKADQDGAAIYVSVGAAPTLINCTFKNNVAKNNGGAVTVYCNAVNGYHTKFYNCTFENNFAYGEGGAIYFDTNQKDFGLLTLVNCLITNNTTLKETGAISLDRNSNLFMLNSTISFNKGSTQGAVLASFGKVPAKSRIVNSIFYQNYGGMLFSMEGEAEKVTNDDKIYYPNIWVQFANCLFEDNDVNALVQRNFDRKKWRTVNELNESIMGKKCIQGNPAFVDPANGNFTPNGGSKAKNAGTSSYFFGYTINAEKRDRNRVTIGCY